MIVPAYTFGVLILCAVLVVFAYLDRVYRELGRGAAGRSHEHLAVFESDVEPRLKIERRHGALGFSILAQLLLALVAIETMRGVLVSVTNPTNAVIELIVYLPAEVLMCTQILPQVLLVRTKGKWLLPLVPAIWAALVVTWPLRAALDLAISVAHISDEEKPEAESQQESIEALVEAAQEEGIIEQGEAELIEQVVEFSDKRVLELMTPRPDIVAVPAAATIAQLRDVMVQAKLSRIVVYDGSLDDVIGIVDSRELLQISESDAAQRTARELARPALFVPETKLGSELLKEMQRRNQQMAIAVDEHGLVGGIITIEDLVEEIVGEMGREESTRSPDVVREPDGSMIMRGSVAIGKLQELFGVELADAADAAATTVAGFLNHLAGHVPLRGEQMESDGLHFEVVDANQRKVLRLRVRRLAAAAPAS